jgi:transcriptional regulator of acetoin/glycerol metabolism
MSWTDLLAIVAAEIDQAAADRIAARATAAMGGKRFTVPKWNRRSKEQKTAALEQAGNAEQAARKLGLSRSTMYRHQRQSRDEQPRMPGTGRIVR